MDAADGGTAAALTEAPEERHVTVSITVNGCEFKVRAGNQSAASIKQLAKIPTADELAVKVNKHKLDVVPDDGSVEIHGGEQFVAYPTACSSA